MEKLIEIITEFKITNNAGEEFKFFLNEESKPCLNVSFEGELRAALIMSKEEFKSLIYNLTMINGQVKY